MKGSVGAQASGGVVMAGCGVWRQGLATGDAREDRNARLGDSGGIEFLATKLVPPRCKGLIPRPRLLDMVPRSPERDWAMIKAPAGFGKTSLAAAWSQELQ
jgi:LuxR family maltose regulon positive regulatory protein